MRLGLLAYATDTGLGYQTKALYKHLKPAKTMVVDLSRFNGMKLHPEWYPDAWRFVRGLPSNDDCDEFLEDLDAVLVCETPLNYRLFERARYAGVRTILQPNPEFFDYFSNPNIPRPAFIGAPSSWMEHELQRAVPGTPIDSLPVPIDLDELPERSITEARHFFHIAGRPAIHDRNGTLDFISAARLAAHQIPAATFTLYCQQPSDGIRVALRAAPMIRLVESVERPSDMYSEGDVLVLPRRYGGLCLPALEAVGSGIPVLMPKVSPNEWLPASWRVPVLPRQQHFLARTKINVYHVHVALLAQRMVQLYRDDAAVRVMHEEAKALAEARSWETLLPRYKEVIGATELVA